MNNQKLSIQKWIPEEIPETLIDFEHLGYYIDTKTNIAVYERRIETDLKVGKLYDFTFDDEYYSDTFTYLILKRDGNVYYMAEYYEYGNGLYKPRYLGGVWIKCDIKEKFGIDLEKYKDFNPHKTNDFEKLTRKMKESVEELDLEIERLKDLIKENNDDVEKIKTLNSQLLIFIELKDNINRSLFKINDF